MTRLATLLLGALLGLLAGIPGVAAQGQDKPDFENKGFYQSYIFGTPDDPDEAWLLAYGGRLYDMWWGVLFLEAPQQTHPAYPEDGPQSGAATWRCAECHGWDYRGKDGRYAAGPHATGIKGITAMVGADPRRIATIVRNETHQFTPELIPDAALDALARFVSKGQFAMERHIDDATGKVSGDRQRGKRIYQNICAICHDFDGGAWITGEDEDLKTLGASASANPWRALHKVLNGQTYADMPALRAFDLQTALDALAYAQSLPPD